MGPLYYHENGILSFIQKSTKLYATVRIKKVLAVHLQRLEAIVVLRVVFKLKLALQ